MSSDEVSPTRFGWSPGRFLCAGVALAVLSCTFGLVTVWLFFSAVLGRWAVPSATLLVVYPVTYTIVYAAVSLVVTRKRPPVLMAGPDRIELAAARCDGVVLPYDAVTRTTVRFRWPFTTLDVFADAAQSARIVPVDRRGRRAPVKVRGGELRFRMPLAGLNERAVRAGLGKLTIGGGAWRSEAATARTAGDG